MPVANCTRMSESDRPQISTDELRAALAPRREFRANPVLISEPVNHAAAELSELRGVVDSARADVIELRAALEAARGDAAELRVALANARSESLDRRAALDQLAGAGPLRRRRVLASLRERGLLSR